MKPLNNKPDQGLYEIAIEAIRMDAGYHPDVMGEFLSTNPEITNPDKIKPGHRFKLPAALYVINGNGISKWE